MERRCLFRSLLAAEGSSKGLYGEEDRLWRMRNKGRVVARDPAVMERPTSMQDQIAIYFVRGLALEGGELVLT